MRIKLFLTVIMIICQVSGLHSQGIRGGEFFITAYSNLSADALVTIYREGEGVPFVLFDWGDGTIDTLDGISVPDYGSGIIVDTYYGLHSYGDYGVYYPKLRDSFLVPDIVNIPNSGEQILSIEDTLYIDNPEEFGINGKKGMPGIQPSQTTIYIDSSGVVTHDMSFVRGGYFTFPVDSLVAFPVPGYTFPAATDTLECCIRWDRPVEPGLYAFAVKVYSYNILDEAYKGTATRLMTIKVDSSMVLSTTSNYTVPPVISLYPNPVADQLHVQLGHFRAEDALLQVLSPQGQVVYTEKLRLSNVLQEHSLSVADWPAGVYVLRVQNGERQWVRRFVVE
jgi:hypothetical protein